MLPEFPRSRPLVLSDKVVFDECFQKLQPIVSEFTFASLYLFRKAHQYEVSHLGNSLVISGKGYDGSSYCLPPFGGDVRSSLEQMLLAGREIYAVDDQLLSSQPDLHSSFVVVEDRDAFDYVYRRTDLALLPGNRYHKKRNRVSYFAGRHSHVVDYYAEGYREGVLQLIDEWLDNRVDSGPISRELEAEAAVGAVKDADQLGLQGVVILVDGKVRAFALGERLNGSTAVCHFEKADPFMEGLFQLVNQKFCQMCFTECEYVNREQDLGQSNLRSTKMSYHPAFFVKKYRLKSDGTI